MSPWALLAGLALGLVGGRGQDPVATTTIEPGFEVAGHRSGDLDGDGAAELLLLAADGRVRTYRPVSGAPAAPGGSEAKGAPEARGALTLPSPARTLVSVVRYGATGYLVCASPAGVVGYPVDAGGAVGSTGAPWIPRAKFQLRVGVPTLTDIVQDVNRDGTADLVIPGAGACELWLGTLEPGKDTPTFRKAATIAVDVVRWGSRDGSFLSDQLESSFSIPGLDTRDVNGDGRPDLLVEQEQRRAFHLQRADGSFPATADVAVDLAIFRDTTEAAELRLGQTLTANDNASWSTRDLDRDGIPDYVIGHRRKVWVFRGTKAGPQFQSPAAILKTAEDITLLSVIELDDDDRPDLLLIKVQIPTLATLLRGLFGEWDVSISALGYRNKGDATFETGQKWENELVMRLPGIIGLLKNPEKLLDRFEELEKRFRTSARGDANGDGAEDVLVVSEDRSTLDLWRGRAGDKAADTSSERKVRELLFDRRGEVWDVDRVLGALGSFAQRQVALQTGGRARDVSLPLRDPAEVELIALECADFDGDGRDEVVVAYRKKADAKVSWFDVLSLR